MNTRVLWLTALCTSGVAIAQAPVQPDENIQVIRALLDGPRTRLAEGLADCAGVSDAGSAIMGRLGKEDRSDFSHRIAEMTIGSALWVYSSQELVTSDPEAFREAQENADAIAWLSPFGTRRTEAILSETNTATTDGSDHERPLTAAQHYCSDLIDAFVTGALQETRKEPHGT